MSNSAFNELLRLCKSEHQQPFYGHIGQFLLTMNAGTRKESAKRLVVWLSVEHHHTTEEYGLRDDASGDAHHIEITEDCCPEHIARELLAAEQGKPARPLRHIENKRDRWT